MAAVQVSASIDCNIKAIAEEVFIKCGFDIPSAIRALFSYAVNMRKMPFAPDAAFSHSRPEVCLNGDLFESDTEYMKQIPGYWENLLELCEAPDEEFVRYDSEEFWRFLKEMGEEKT